MSAVYSIVFPNSVQILTDGASYTKSGLLIGAKDKVATSKSIPLAVTGRGSSILLEAFGEMITMLGDLRGSFDQTLEEAQDMLSRNTEKLKDKGVQFELLVAGWSETRGPCHALFTTHDAYPDVKPWAFHWMPNDCGLGPVPNPLQLAAGGLKLEKMREAGEDGLRLYGADLMEVIRRMAGSNFTDSDSPVLFGVGCHCDLTVITKDRAETTRLRTWDDPVGEPIDPFRELAEAA